MIKRRQDILAISLILGLYGLFSIYGSVKDLILFITIDSISQPILSSSDSFGRLISIENVFGSPIIYLLFIIGFFMVLKQNKSGVILLFFGALGGLLLSLQKYIWVAFKNIYSSNIYVWPPMLLPIVYAVAIFIIVKHQKVQNQS